MTIGLPKSLKEYMDTKKAALALPGEINGRVMVLNIPHSLSHRSLAAYSKVGFILFNTPESVKAATG